MTSPDDGDDVAALMRIIPNQGDTVRMRINGSMWDITHVATVTIDGLNLADGDDVP